MIKKQFLILLLIIIIGIFFRTYKFNQIPASLNWDEVAIGWNAAAIWEAKIDQYGTRWPLSFKSYGDFKAPLLIYSTAPFIGLFGIKDWAVRLPVLIVSILSIGLIYLLSLEIASLLNLKHKTQLFSLLNTFLFAISPWHIRFSRAAFEANFALFFILLGIIFLFYSLRKFHLILLSFIFFIFSLYSYHSPKIFVPIFLISFFIIFRKEIISKIKANKIIIPLSIIISLMISYPLIKDTFFGDGAERGGTLIFYENNKLVSLNFILLKQILSNTWAHLSPKFYIFGSDANFRNNLKNIGLMPFVQYIIFGVGIINLLLNKSHRKISILLFTWFIAGLLPGILSKSDTVPHTIRTLNALPVIVIISSLGFIYLIDYIKDKKIVFFNNQIKVIKPLIILLSTLLIFFLSFFYHEYFHNFPVYGAKDWQFGYSKAVQIAQEYESEVDKIIVTSKYGHPYLFFAFYEQRNPLYVIWGEMSKYQFQDKINWDGEKYSKNVLLIASPEEIPENIDLNRAKVINKVNFPDNLNAFTIIKTN